MFSLLLMMGWVAVQNPQMKTQLKMPLCFLILKSMAGEHEEFFSSSEDLSDPTKRIQLLKSIEVKIGSPLAEATTPARATIASFTRAEKHFLLSVSFDEARLRLINRLSPNEISRYLPSLYFEGLDRDKLVDFFPGRFSNADLDILRTTTSQNILRFVAWKNPIQSHWFTITERLRKILRFQERAATESSLVILDERWESLDARGIWLRLNTWLHH